MLKSNNEIEFASEHEKDKGKDSFKKESREGLEQVVDGDALVVRRVLNMQVKRMKRKERTSSIQDLI